MRLRLVPLPAAAVWGGASETSETSAVVRARVNASRERQRERACRDDVASLNAKLRPDELVRACRLSKATLSAVEQAAQRLRLSARGLHRVLRISRTVADQNGALNVEQQHLHEALNYRALEDD